MNQNTILAFFLGVVVGILINMTVFFAVQQYFPATNQPVEPQETCPYEEGECPVPDCYNNINNIFKYQ